MGAYGAASAGRVFDSPPRVQSTALWRLSMAVGRVKWFNDEKGWGFIKQDEGPDVFVHYSQIHGDGRRRLFEDELVEFEIKEGPKGLQAVNVMRQDGVVEAAQATA
jgi:CspA family cold shock protein